MRVTNGIIRFSGYDSSIEQVANDLEFIRPKKPGREWSCPGKYF
jgi:hypothetical protein